jgi:hypothetical protein
LPPLTLAQMLRSIARRLAQGGLETNS